MSIKNYIETITKDRKYDERGNLIYSDEKLMCGNDPIEETSWTYDYNDNNTLKSSIYNNDWDFSETEYEYNKDEYTTITSYEDSENKIESLYDNDGKELRRTFIDGDGSTKLIFENKYGENKIINTSYNNGEFSGLTYSEDINLPNWGSINIEKKDSYSKPKFDVELNNDDNTTSRYTNNANYSMLEDIYDANGNLICTKQYLLAIVTTNKYDENNNVIQSENHMMENHKPKLAQSTVYDNQYDQNGRLTHVDISKLYLEDSYRNDIDLDEWYSLTNTEPLFDKIL